MTSATGDSTLSGINLGVTSVTLLIAAGDDSSLLFWFGNEVVAYFGYGQQSTLNYVLTDEKLPSHIAVKAYIIRGTGMKEFQDGLETLQVQSRRLLKQYEKTGEIADHLILRPISSLLHNVLGPATVPLLFFKFEEKSNGPRIKTFLVFLEYLPDNYMIQRRH